MGSLGFLGFPVYPPPGLRYAPPTKNILSDTGRTKLLRDNTKSATFPSQSQVAPGVSGHRRRLGVGRERPRAGGPAVFHGGRLGRGYPTTGQHLPRLLQSTA